MSHAPAPLSTAGPMMRFSAHRPLHSLKRILFVSLFFTALGPTAYAGVFCDGEAATIVGTPADDNIQGTPQRDVIAAGLGNDTISALAGSDLVCGDQGDDRITGGPGDDKILGERLIFIPSTSGVQVDLRRGLSRGEGHDTLVDVIDAVGTTSDDVILANNKRNFLSGLGGDDLIRGRGARDDVFGGKGDDTLMTAGGGADVAGSLGDDFIKGDYDDDVFFRPSTTGVRVDLRRDRARGEGRDTLMGSTDIFGTNDADVILADGKENFLSGLSGDDLIRGRSGRDDIFAGRGDDRLATGPDGDYAEGEGGNDRITGGEGRDRLGGDKGRDAVHGGTEADSVGGGVLFDVVHGGAGEDFVSGGTSRDLVQGGRGGDRVGGSLSRDLLDGGQGHDIALTDAHDGPIKIDISRQTVEARWGASKADRLRNIEGASGTERGKDILIGDGQANTFFTGGDSLGAERRRIDLVIARGGDDMISVAGRERDKGDVDIKVRAGAGYDIVRFPYIAHEPLHITASLTENTFSWANTIGLMRSVEGLYGGGDQDRLEGDEKSNIFKGRHGDDQLFGLAGSDTLDGGPGSDELSGGKGKDRCRGESRNNCEN